MLKEKHFPANCWLSDPSLVPVVRLHLYVITLFLCFWHLLNNYEAFQGLAPSVFYELAFYFMLASHLNNSIWSTLRPFNKKPRNGKLGFVSCQIYGKLLINLELLEQHLNIILKWKTSSFLLLGCTQMLDAAAVQLGNTTRILLSCGEQLDFFDWMQRPVCNTFYEKVQKYILLKHNYWHFKDASRSKSRLQYVAFNYLVYENTLALGNLFSLFLTFVG